MDSPPLTTCRPSTVQDELIRYQERMQRTPPTHHHPPLTIPPMVSTTVQDELIRYQERAGAQRMLRLDSFADHTTKVGACLQRPAPRSQLAAAPCPQRPAPSDVCAGPAQPPVHAGSPWRALCMLRRGCRSGHATERGWCDHGPAPMPQDTWDLSAWIRVYSVYLDDRLATFKAIRFSPDLGMVGRPVRAPVLLPLGPP